MKLSRLLFSLSLILLTGTSMQAQYRNKRYIEYIDTYNEIAIEQMRIHRIPASITLAQGLLESGAGQSTLAKKSNNHFGIKCGNWSGRKVYHDDDARDECFRAYRNPQMSYEDHSKFLTSGARYDFLFRLSITDYKAWARGLKKAGYATDPSYANRLIQIIENYDLYKYDSRSRRKKEYSEPIVMNPHQANLANDLLYVIARQGDSFESIGKEFDIRPRKLAKYNELDKEYTLAQGDIVFLHEKKKRAPKGYTVHIVGDDDSMHSIAQRYGIRLKNLYKMNKKDPEDYVPEVGERLRVR